MDAEEIGSIIGGIFVCLYCTIPILNGIYMRKAKLQISVLAGIPTFPAAAGAMIFLFTFVEFDEDESSDNHQIFAYMFYVVNFLLNISFCSYAMLIHNSIHWAISLAGLILGVASISQFYIIHIVGFTLRRKNYTDIIAMVFYILGALYPVLVSVYLHMYLCWIQLLGKFEGKKSYTNILWPLFMLIGHSLLCPEAYKHEHFCFFAACLGAIANSFGALVLCLLINEKDASEKESRYFIPEEENRGESVINSDINITSSPIKWEEGVSMNIMGTGELMVNKVNKVEKMEISQNGEERVSEEGSEKRVEIEDSHIYSGNNMQSNNIFESKYDVTVSELDSPRFSYQEGDPDSNKSNDMQFMSIQPFNSSEPKLRVMATLDKDTITELAAIGRQINVIITDLDNTENLQNNKQNTYSFSDNNEDYDYPKEETKEEQPLSERNSDKEEGDSKILTMEETEKLEELTVGEIENDFGEEGEISVFGHESAYRDTLRDSHINIYPDTLSKRDTLKYFKTEEEEEEKLPEEAKEECIQTYIQAQ